MRSNQAPYRGHRGRHFDWQSGNPPGGCIHEKTVKIEEAKENERKRKKRKKRTIWTLNNA
jgi:hypothetical protein